MPRLVRNSLVALAVLSGAAMAQPPSLSSPASSSGSRFVERMDTNRDGSVTRPEVTSVLEKQFAGIDTNRDGSISSAEVAAHRQMMRDRRFEQRFVAMDGNRDGLLSREELRTARGAARAEGHGDKHRGGTGKAYSFHPTGSSADAGADQAKTKAAFMQRALTRFDLLDSNDDGKITAVERDAAPYRGRHDDRQEHRPTPKS